MIKLTRHQRSELRKYGRPPDSRTVGCINKPLEKYLAKLREENPTAFHTEKTLKDRRFFHRPRDRIVVRYIDGQEVEVHDPMMYKSYESLGRK